MQYQMTADANYLTTSPNSQDFEFWIRVSHWTMALSALVFLASILVSYPYAHNFSVGEQVLAHIVAIIAPALFKIAYVVRCLARYNLGKAV